MTFLGFDIDPEGILEIASAGIATGATIGVLFVLLTLFYGRQRT